MAELKCLLWDVDGTLADTEKDGHRVAFNMAFEEAGMDRRWSDETYGELLKVTGGKERMQFDIERGGMPEIPYEKIAQLHARKTIHYQTLIADGLIPLRAGVLRLLEDAYADGITLGVSTTTTPSALDALIEHSLGKEWCDRFAVLAAGDIVPSKKPAPDIYNYALEQLGIAPENTVALEDSGNGWLSSRDAGIKTVITINDYTANQDFTGADLVVSEFGEADRPAVDVLINKHNLDGVHHVTLAHLQAICEA